MSDFNIERYNPDNKIEEKISILNNEISYYEHLLDKSISENNVVLIKNYTKLILLYVKFKEELIKSHNKNKLQ